MFMCQSEKITDAKNKYYIDLWLRDNVTVKKNVSQNFAFLNFGRFMFNAFESTTMCPRYLRVFVHFF